MSLQLTTAKKSDQSDYELRLTQAVDRWLGNDVRSLAEIIARGDLTDAELEDACDVASTFNVEPSDVVTAIGEFARAEVLP